MLAGESSDHRIYLFLRVWHPLENVGMVRVRMRHANHILTGDLVNDCLSYCLGLVAHALLGDDLGLNHIAHVGQLRGEEGEVMGEGYFLFLLDVHFSGFPGEFCGDFQV